MRGPARLYSGHVQVTTIDRDPLGGEISSQTSSPINFIATETDLGHLPGSSVALSTELCPESAVEAYKTREAIRVVIFPRCEPSFQDFRLSTECMVQL